MPACKPSTVRVPGRPLVPVPDARKTDVARRLTKITSISSVVTIVPREPEYDGDSPSVPQF